MDALSRGRQWLCPHSLPERGWSAGEGLLPLSLGKKDRVELGVPLAFLASISSPKQVPMGEAKKDVTPTVKRSGSLVGQPLPVTCTCMCNMPEHIHLYRHMSMYTLRDLSPAGTGSLGDPAQRLTPCQSLRFGSGPARLQHHTCPLPASGH